MTTNERKSRCSAEEMSCDELASAAPTATADPRAETVSVTRDPGHGFGREARKCAVREKYAPALNVDGIAIPGVYRVNFRFSR